MGCKDKQEALGAKFSDVCTRHYLIALGESEENGDAIVHKFPVSSIKSVESSQPRAQVECCICFDRL